MVYIWISAKVMIDRHHYDDADEKVVQYDMETDTWTELPQKLEARRHAILTIPVPR